MTETPPQPKPQRKPRQRPSVKQTGALAVHGKTHGIHEDEKAKIWDARIAGMSFEQIGRGLNMSRETVSRLWYVTIEDLVPVAEVDEIRRIEAERIDQLRFAQWKAAKAGDTKAAQTWLRLTERYARMLGVDMPERHVLEVHMQQVKVEVSATLLRIINDADLPPEARTAVLEAIAARSE